MNDKHNGWTNYPTWCVFLWLTNDEDTCERYVSLARQAKGDDYPVGTLAGDIKATVREEDDHGHPDLSGDLLGWAFDCVNWREIAEAFLEHVEDSESA